MMSDAKRVAKGLRRGGNTCCITTGQRRVAFMERRVSSDTFADERYRPNENQMARLEYENHAKGHDVASGPI